MFKGMGRFINRPTKTGGKHYDKHFIYVPSELARDSQFPFNPGEKVTVTIDGKRLVVEKL